MSAAAGLPDPAFWHGRRVLVTGHTGFIGGWLCAWLHALGAEVSGLALPPATRPSFHDLTGLDRRMRANIVDVRSTGDLARVFVETGPRIVFHLAAQALVREGYSNPSATFDVNLMGTVNVLEQVRLHPPEALVVMTSDKVYASGDLRSAHLETDPLGPGDPYGASKAGCELALEAYARSFFQSAGIGNASVRAGNVIGGGDWGEDRLVPDAMRAFARGQPLSLRHPSAVRPWQHVLDAVNGLLLVAADAARAGGSTGAWNIGPMPDPPVTVGALAQRIAAGWDDGARISIEERQDFPENPWLAIDSRRARTALSLRSPWTIEQAVVHTTAWYKRALSGGDAWAVTQEQIASYVVDCRLGRNVEAAG